MAAAAAVRGRINLDYAVDTTNVKGLDTKKLGRFLPEHIEIKPSWGYGSNIKNYYEIVDPKWYPTQVEQYHQPVEMNRLGPPLEYVIQTELLPYIHKTLQIPPPGWTLTAQLEDQRPDGLPGFALLNLRANPADLHAKTRGQTAVISNMMPELDSDNGAKIAERMGKVIFNEYRQKMQNFTSSERQQKFKSGGMRLGAEFRRDVVCMQSHTQWIPQYEGLVRTETRTTHVARVIFAKFWETHARKEGKNKQARDPQPKELSPYYALGFEGSLPVNWRSAFMRHGLHQAPIDKETVAALNVFRNTLDDPAAPVQFTCRDDEIYGKPGRRDFCLQLFGLGDLSDPDMLMPEHLVAVQCLGAIPLHSIAVYKQFRNKGGITQHNVVRLCTPTGWSDPKNVTETEWQAAHTECKGRLAARPLPSFDMTDSKTKKKNPYGLDMM